MISGDLAEPSEKPFRCETCERRFARLEHLQRHVRTHTKERPFVCFCGRRFTRNDLLKRHRGRAHASVHTGPEAVPPLASLVEQHLSDDHAQADTALLSSLSHDEGLFYAGDVSFGEVHLHIDGPHSPLHEFATFMDSIGLVPDWDSLDVLNGSSALQQTGIHDDQREWSQQSSFRLPNGISEEGTITSLLQGLPQQTPNPAVTQGVESVPTSIPSASPTVVDAPSLEQARKPMRWNLTEEHWQTLAEMVAMSQQSLSGFTLPSRPAMSRYFQSYTDHFHDFYPMIHLPTYCIASSPLSLTLAIAAVGAQCKFESKTSLPLYEAARALTLGQSNTRSLHDNRDKPDEHRTSMIQSLVLLMSYGAWDANTDLLDGALDLQSTLSGYMRASLRNRSPADDSSLQWKCWVRAETHRRTLLLAYAYLVVQSVTYDLPPVALVSDIQNCVLPCASTIWEAYSEDEWRSALSRSTQGPVRLVDALRSLLDNTIGNADTTLRLSAVGSFVVLQALIQRIYLTRQLHTTLDAALPRAELEALQQALMRWKTLRQRVLDSSLDSSSATGPVQFTSTAFLAMAFARLHIDTGPCRQLHTRNPEQVAIALLSTPVPQCSPDAVAALLHAAHALSVPVLMGVDSVLASQTIAWSCEHSLCGLESAIFLWRWLQSAGESLTWDDLDTNERGIVSWVLFCVSETLQSVPATDLGLSDGTVLAELSYPKLGILVLKIWARVFSSTRSWAITNEIGASLSLLASAVEAA